MSIFDRIAAAAMPAGLAICGTSVQYQRPPAAAFAVTAIWTARAGEPTTAWFRLADFTAAPAKNDRVTKDGHVYKVVETATDGAGGVTLTLRMIGAA